MPTQASPPIPARATERRRGRRVAAEDIRLRCATMEVRLLDLSEEGLAVESHESLRIGARYRFTLEEPQAKSFVGTVLWCRLLRTRAGEKGDVLPVYRAGLTRD